MTDVSCRSSNSRCYHVGLWRGSLLSVCPTVSAFVAGARTFVPLSAIRRCCSYRLRANYCICDGGGGRLRRHALLPDPQHNNKKAAAKMGEEGKQQSRLRRIRRKQRVQRLKLHTSEMWGRERERAHASGRWGLERRKHFDTRGALLRRADLVERRDELLGAST